MKPNEWLDQQRLVAAAAGQNLILWFKAAETTSIAYAAGEGYPMVSIAEAEERFLDWYYAPLFGHALGERLGR